MKIWYFVSFLFFILSVLTLIEDRYEVTYRLPHSYKSIEEEAESFDTIICFPMKEIEIYSNRSEIDLNLLKDELYEYLNRSKSLFDAENLEYERLVLNEIKRSNYLITMGQFCFGGIDEYDSVEFYPFENILEDQRRFAINWETFYLVEIEHPLTYYDRMIVLNKAYPYSNCADNYSKFQCLNKCFKRKNRLSKYWYSGNETDGIIKLNYDNNNQTLKKDEGECFKECKKENCKLVYILPICKFSSDSFKFIEARPLIFPFDYWTQLIGLFVLFTNICFYQIYSKLISKINSIVKKPKHRRCVTIARYTTLILVGFGFLAQFIIKVTEFKNKQTKSIRFATFKSIESNSFSIVVCFYVMINKDLTLLILEQKTSEMFNESFKGIHLEFENKRKQVDFTLSQKVIFFTDKRCFHLVPHLKEVKYQSLFSTSKLIIELKQKNYFLYLIPDDQNFNSKSYLSFPYFNYIKKVIKRSKLKKCVDYRELNSNFRNRWDSIDQCINRKYIYRTGKMNFYSIIDRDHYTDAEWKLSYVEDNETAYNEIKENCEKEIQEEDCYEIKFEDGNQITPPDNRDIEKIELYTHVEWTGDENTSIYKAILDFLNILSVLFGLNVLQLLQLISQLIKIKFKWCLLFIYLLCSIGLTYHIFYILNEIISEDLIYSQHYEVLESIKMTDTIFCFEFNQIIIDKNYQLTGNYLNDITNEMRVDMVFEEISYLSKSNEWITLNSTSNYTTDEFKMELFFFVNKKCFKLKLEIEYNWKLFLFSLDSKVLQIYFNSMFIHQEKKVTNLMSRVENSMQFTKIDLSFRDYDGEKCSYLIYQESFELIHNDKFHLIKNPISLLYGENDVNDPDRYLKRLINCKRGLSTLNLPLEKDAFNNEIDDDLFEQYYLQVQNITDYQTPTNSNYKRIFATNYFESYEFDTSGPDLTVYLIQFTKKLTMTNSDNFTKLILNLLNASSVWFGLGVLNLHVYVHLLFHKIRCILIFLYRLILDFERFILIRL